MQPVYHSLAGPSYRESSRQATKSVIDVSTPTETKQLIGSPSCFSWWRDGYNMRNIIYSLDLPSYYNTMSTEDEQALCQISFTGVD